MRQPGCSVVEDRCSSGDSFSNIETGIDVSNSVSPTPYLSSQADFELTKENAELLGSTLQELYFL